MKKILLLLLVVSGLIFAKEKYTEGVSYEKDGVVFVLKKAAKSVFIAGSFNDWNPSKDALKQVEKNIWKIKLPLSPGKYEYKYVIDATTWITDPANPEKITDPQGIENSIVVVKGPKGLSPPHQTKDGWQFSFYAPDAKAVYLAGDFNNWANNQDGVITDKDYLMKKDETGIWIKTVKLTPGEHKYKFVVDGKPEGWKSDPLNPTPPDDWGNSIIVVTAQAKLGAGPKQIKEGVEFSYSAADAKSVYLAGEFNNWSTSSTPMKKDKSGNWKITIKLSPGKYKYKFVVDGQWTEDPNGIPSGDEYGNSLVIVK